CSFPTTPPHVYIPKCSGRRDCRMCNAPAGQSRKCLPGPIQAPSEAYLRSRAETLPPAFVHLYPPRFQAYVWACQRSCSRSGRVTSAIARRPPAVLTGTLPCTTLYSQPPPGWSSAIAAGRVNEWSGKTAAQAPYSWSSGCQRKSAGPQTSILPGWKYPNSSQTIYLTASTDEAAPEQDQYRTRIFAAENTPWRTRSGSTICRRSARQKAAGY